MRRSVFALTVLMVGLCGVGVAQTLKPRPPAGTQQNEDEPATQKESESADGSPIMMPMTVEEGTPIKVALDSEVRIRAVGQTIHGRTIEPVYAFDNLLIPVGTVVNGKVAAIDPVPKMARTMQAANGKFSPVRKVHVQFDELVMADGQRIALHTVASPAPAGVLRFVSANEAEKKKNKMQEAASNKVSATRQAIHQQWSDLQTKVHEPGVLNAKAAIMLSCSGVKILIAPQFPTSTSPMTDLSAPSRSLIQPLLQGVQTAFAANLILWR